MRDIDQLAVSKAISAAELRKARANVSPGSYPVDVVVHVDGTLTVHQDEEYRPTAEIPIKSTLALFIRYCGVTRDAAENALIKAMKEALKREQVGADKAKTILEPLKETAVIDNCMARVLKLARQLPLKTRKGKVTAKLKCEVVNPAEVPAL